MSSKRYPSRLESRAGFFASTRDECLSPRVRLECNPEIPVAPGEEHWLLDTSLDEVYWPCSHSRAIPSFPSQLEWKIGLAWWFRRRRIHLPMQETQVRSLGQEDPLEKEMATHSSTLAWKIPQTEERGRLQSLGSQRVGHNWATSLLCYKIY